MRQGSVEPEVCKQTQYDGSVRMPKNLQWSSPDQPKLAPPSECPSGLNIPGQSSLAGAPLVPSSHRNHTKSSAAGLRSSTSQFTSSTFENSLHQTPGQNSPSRFRHSTSQILSAPSSPVPRHPTFTTPASNTIHHQVAWGLPPTASISLSRHSNSSLSSGLKTVSDTLTRSPPASSLAPLQKQQPQQQQDSPRSQFVAILVPLPVPAQQQQQQRLHSATIEISPVSSRLSSSSSLAPTEQESFTDTSLQALAHTAEALRHVTWGGEEEGDLHDCSLVKHFTALHSSRNTEPRSPDPRSLNHASAFQERSTSHQPPPIHSQATAGAPIHMVVDSKPATSAGLIGQRFADMDSSKSSLVHGRLDMQAAASNSHLLMLPVASPSTPLDNSSPSLVHADLTRAVGSACEALAARLLLNEQTVAVQSMVVAQHLAWHASPGAALPVPPTSHPSDSADRALLQALLARVLMLESGNNAATAAAAPTAAATAAALSALTVANTSAAVREASLLSTVSQLQQQVVSLSSRVAVFDTTVQVLSNQDTKTRSELCDASKREAQLALCVDVLSRRVEDQGPGFVTANCIDPDQAAAAAAAAAAGVVEQAAVAAAGVVHFLAVQSAAALVAEAKLAAEFLNSAAIGTAAAIAGRAAAVAAPAVAAAAVAAAVAAAATIAEACREAAATIQTLKTQTASILADINAAKALMSDAAASAAALVPQIAETAAGMPIPQAKPLKLDLQARLDSLDTWLPEGVATGATMFASGLPDKEALPSPTKIRVLHRLSSKHRELTVSQQETQAAFAASFKLGAQSLETSTAAISHLDNRTGSNQEQQSALEIRVSALERAGGNSNPGTQETSARAWTASVELNTRMLALEQHVAAEITNLLTQAATSKSVARDVNDRVSALQGQVAAEMQNFTAKVAMSNTVGRDLSSKLSALQGEMVAADFGARVTALEITVSSGQSHHAKQAKQSTELLSLQQTCASLAARVDMIVRDHSQRFNPTMELDPVRNAGHATDSKLAEGSLSEGSRLAVEGLSQKVQALEDSIANAGVSMAAKLAASESACAGFAAACGVSASAAQKAAGAAAAAAEVASTSAREASVSSKLTSTAAASVAVHHGTAFAQQQQLTAGQIPNRADELSAGTQAELYELVHTLDAKLAVYSQGIEVVEAEMHRLSLESATAVAAQFAGVRQDVKRAETEMLRLSMDAATAVAAQLGAAAASAAASAATTVTAAATAVATATASATAATTAAAGTVTAAAAAAQQQACPNINTPALSAAVQSEGADDRLSNPHRLSQVSALATLSSTSTPEKSVRFIPEQVHDSSELQQQQQQLLLQLQTYQQSQSDQDETQLAREQEILLKVEERLKKVDEGMEVFRHSLLILGQRLQGLETEVVANASRPSPISPSNASNAPMPHTNRSVWGGVARSPSPSPSPISERNSPSDSAFSNVRNSDHRDIVALASSLQALQQELLALTQEVRNPSSFLGSLGKTKHQPQPSSAAMESVSADRIRAAETQIRDFKQWIERELQAAVDRMELVEATLLRRDRRSISNSLPGGGSTGGSSSAMLSAIEEQIQYITDRVEFSEGEVKILTKDLRGVRNELTVLASASSSAAVAAATATAAAAAVDVTAATARSRSPLHRAGETILERGSPGTSPSHASDTALRRAQSEQLKHLEARIEGLAGEMASAQRDKKLSEIGSARMVDLKESENNLMERYTRLHNSVDALKESVRILQAPPLSARNSIPHASGGNSPISKPRNSSMDMAQSFATLAGLKDLDASTTAAVTAIQADVQVLDENVIELDSQMTEMGNSTTKRMGIQEKVMMKIARQIEAIEDQLYGAKAEKPRRN